jgi:hypothetical protein
MKTRTNNPFLDLLKTVMRRMHMDGLSPSLSCVLLLLSFSATSSASGDQFRILTKVGLGYSSHLEISAGESFAITSASYKRISDGDIFSADNISIWYTDSQDNEVPLSRWGDVKVPLEIMGPSKIRIKGPSSAYASRLFGILKSVDANSSASTAKYATVIPENSKTKVSVVLEQSTDMVNWTTVNPGEFVPSTQKRFFRLRSANVPVAVTGASNASPIVITSAGHSLNTGDSISISGVQGNVAANGTFTVTKVDANSFNLNGSTGNGAYTSGGTWLPSP